MYRISHEAISRLVLSARNPASQLRPSVLIFLAGSLALCIYLYAQSFRVEIPFVDTWHLMEQIRDRWETGASLSSYMLATHNDHPHGVASFLYLLTGPSFGPMMSITIIATLSIALILGFVADRSTNSLLAAGLCVVITLSPRQDELYLTAIMTPLALCVLFGLIALLLATNLTLQVTPTQKVISLSSILLLVCLAALSNATAVGVFAAVSINLVLQRSRIGLVGASLVSVLGISWLLIFFFGGSTRVSYPSPEIAGGFLILCGAPLFEQRLVSGICGIIILVGFAAFGIRERTNPKFRLAISVGIMSLIMVLSIAYGRGMMSGVNPGRYATFSAPLTAIVISYFVGDFWRRNEYARIAICMATVASLIIAVPRALSVGTWHKGIADRGGAMILDAENVFPATLATINPWPNNAAIEQINFMKRHHINVFADGLPLQVRAARYLSRLALLHRVRTTPPGIEASDEGMFAHAPAKFDISVDGANNLIVEFGLRDEVWKHGSSEGVCFKISTKVTGTLWQRCLDPRSVKLDRGPQSARVTLPAGMDTVTLETGCINSCAYAWSYWSEAKPDKNGDK